MNGDTRITPYPPSFSKIAANSIDPTTGASTCALGNHRWPKKIGSFTKNAKTILIKNKFGVGVLPIVMLN